MASFGPQYCETPDVVSGVFPVEPANAISSGVIVLFGIAALWLVRRRAPNAVALYAACGLIIVNGVGSILWHGLRERWALTLDVVPALIFVLLVLFLWARRAAPLWQAGVAVAALLALPTLLRYADLDLGFYGRWAAMAPVLVMIGVWLVVRSHAVSTTAAVSGAAALVSAVTALTFRTIDGAVCANVPFGTHFLWHIFLSAAAFLCVLAVVSLGPARAARGGAPGADRPAPAPSP